MIHNHYFETIEPVFYFEKIGISLSNTYIGRMRAFDNVYVGRNSEPEDVFHLLVGGDFVVSADGKVREIAFWHPKPLLEKTYGPLPQSSDLFERLEKQGIARRVPEPRGKTDYASCRKNQPELPENHFRLRYDANSTTRDRIEDLGVHVRDAAVDLGLDVTFRDFYLDRRAVMQVSRVEGQKRELVFETNLLENGDLFVKPSEAFFDCKAFVAALRGSPMVKQTHVYEHAFWTNDAAFLLDDEFIEQVSAGFAKAAQTRPPAAAPAAPRR